MSKYNLSHLDSKGRNIIHAVHKRAKRDEQFRDLAMADPQAAIEEVTGERIPSSFKIRFYDGTGFDFVSVLPDLESTGELDEDELDMVAGGNKGGGYDGDGGGYDGDGDGGG